MSSEGPTKRVHPKIAPKEYEKLRRNESLLSKEDKEKVEKIREFVRPIHQEMHPIVNEINKIQKELNAISQNIIPINDALSPLQDYIQDLDPPLHLRNKRKPVTIEACLKRILVDINGGTFDFGQPIKDIDGLQKQLGLGTPLESEQNKNQLLSELIQQQGIYQKKKDALMFKEEDLFKKKSALEVQVEQAKEKLKAYSQREKIIFDIDEYFNLAKITRKKEKHEERGANGPEFSVVFAQKDGQIRPFVLYRGKEYEGGKRQLGEGGYGRVKLAQDYQTNELFAVKIQSQVDDYTLQQEKGILASVGVFEGTLKRDSHDNIPAKDYIMQELYYGEDLQNLIAQNELSENESLQLLTKAAIALNQYHEKNLIHRDIKLENFIWDKDIDKAHLIDLASVVKVKGDKPFKPEDPSAPNPLVGTPEYLSTEAQERIYSKKSDVFAFGVMMKKILEENHPGIYAQMQEFIEAQMMAENPAERPSMKDVRDMLSRLSKRSIADMQEQVALDSPSSPVGSSPSSPSPFSGSPPSPPSSIGSPPESIESPPDSPPRSASWESRKSIIRSPLPPSQPAVEKPAPLPGRERTGKLVARYEELSKPSKGVDQPKAPAKLPGKGPGAKKR